MSRTIRSDVVGIVVELPDDNPFKAILEFNSEEDDGRVILWSNRLYVDGIKVNGGGISDYLSLGNRLRFSCHRYDHVDPDLCQWFAIHAHLMEEDEDYNVLGLQKFPLVSGLINRRGFVEDVGKRQAIITVPFDNDSKSHHRILLLGSKLFLFGQRVTSKTSLLERLKLEDYLMVDAVPIDEDNEFECAWLATIGWMGSKPFTKYASKTYPCIRRHNFDMKYSMNYFKRMFVNPYNDFYRGRGKVMAVLSSEYAVCLGQMMPNNWQTVLFHRSAAFLFGTSLTDTDLQTVFKEGDRVRYIAVPCSSDSCVQWVAKQVVIDTSQVQVDY